MSGKGRENWLPRSSKETESPVKTTQNGKYSVGLDHMKGTIQNRHTNIQRRRGSFHKKTPGKDGANGLVIQHRIFP